MDRFAAYPLRILTDLYQLTMLRAYAQTGKAEQQAVFRMYFRRLPAGGGFAVCAGLAEAVAIVSSLHGFSDAELSYLGRLDVFRDAPGDFWDRLRRFRFSGTIEALPEGTLVFPEMPMLQVSGPLFEAQLLESLLLCLMGFPTLVATEAAHCCHAAGDRAIIEFGMRRAQGPDGAIMAARAAYLGGCAGTSNVAAGMLFDIPVIGTHAHSFVQAFDSELEAFEAYASVFPDHSVLLVDTIDTLASGVPHAVRVGRALADSGHVLRGIRLDSGDLVELSQGARRQLDAAGLSAAHIVASSDLDPPTIEQLLAQGAQIDSFGVGTRLATSLREPALGCVYKLVELDGVPRVKISSHTVKRTIPGRQYSWRLVDSTGQFLGDVLLPAGEVPSPPEIEVLDVRDPTRRATIRFDRALPLLVTAIRQGEPQPIATLHEARRHAQEQLLHLTDGCKRLSNPEPYLAGMSVSTWQQMERTIARMP
jgi:nicotinate phosphoribosyltransferase